MFTIHGKAHIQVVDNGKGMSENDARMCFEHHATSKISTACSNGSIDEKRHYPSYLF